MIKRIGRPAIAICMAIALVATLSSPAQAHYVYEKGEIYKSADVCVDGRAEVSHGDGGGYARADTWSETRGFVYGVGWVNCAVGWSRPAGYIAARYDYLVFDLSAGVWGLCRQLDWWYGSGSHLTVAWNFGNRTPCGTAWYATIGWSAVRNGSTWNGGEIASGNHWLDPPLTLTAQHSAQPPRPAWVRKNGTIDSAKFPDELPVMSDDGRLRRDGTGAPVLTPISKVPPLVADAEALQGSAEAERTVIVENGVRTEIIEVAPTRPAT
ncbi:hypothetical protein [Nonomuraea sp. SBT364]|uniref:hypothetical protein n=1 Tax=Nonomuraea sp. SBT364 TaxID=1580530 RepID=UPI000AB250CB|nr:hypothetical protein [Nonomuraea sp. SBT364]